MALGRSFQLIHDRVRQGGRHGHLAAIPARHRRLAGGRALHERGHLVHPHQLQDFASEQETFSGLEPGNEAFFDGAQASAAPLAGPVPHLHAGVADDGADAHAVTARQARIGHAPHARIVGHHAAVVGIGGKGLATLSDKIQAPLPGFA